MAASETSRQTEGMETSLLKLKAEDKGKIRWTSNYDKYNIHFPLLSKLYYNIIITTSETGV